MDIGEDLKSTQTSFDILRSSTLMPGITYYSNVLAYGFSDIHHTESSDGFKPDQSKPVEGIVFDGIGKRSVYFIVFKNIFRIYTVGKGHKSSIFSSFKT